MFPLLWLIPAIPFAGFLALALAGSRLSRRSIATVGVGSVGLSALLTILIGFAFLTSPPPEHAYSQTLWTWMDVAGFTPGIAFHLDALSLVMVLVVTVVGFLIHLYSAAFMEGEEGYSRFFGYMNLFVGAMLTLVLADNLLLLYLGWEGVGLCSYLLIGFWYRDPANGHAARKAFIVTRVGDTAMAIGLFLLFAQLGTLHIQDLLDRAAEQWTVGAALPVAAAALLLGGAVGKSAQLPLQTWLPDAMAGPTPVSALIHAATMVTAGVYLIARTHVIFTLAPVVQTIVAVVGAVTLLVAGFSALTQWDIKRILAYSTMSQIGYMFLALGVGAWSAAMFHFMTHALFKALLFLGAGVVTLALHHEHNIFRMGGLRRQLPITFWTFLIGSGALAAFPLITAGFYSKDLILWEVWSSAQGGPWLWAAGLAGALITSVYTFRMVFLVFLGETRSQVDLKPGRCLRTPLIVLAGLAIAGGFVELPHTLGHLPIFSDFMASVLPAQESHVSVSTEWILQVTATLAALIGIWIAHLAVQRSWFVVQETGSERRPTGSALSRFWYTGWGFDWLYAHLFIRPFVWVARVNKGDAFDRLYDAIVWLAQVLHRALRTTQTGRVRWYAAGIALGAVVVVAIVVVL